MAIFYFSFALLTFKQNFKTLNTYKSYQQKYFLLLLRTHESNYYCLSSIGPFLKQFLIEIIWLYCDDTGFANCFATSKESKEFMRVIGKA